MKEIAYIALTPLGDVICCMNQLEHLKKTLYAPYEKTRHAVVHASCADYESCLKCRERDCGREFTYTHIFNMVKERSQE